MRYSILICCALAAVSLGGCANPEADNADPNMTNPVSRDQLKNAPSRFSQPLPVTYRVTGTAKGITGTYTDVSGAPASIPVTVPAFGSTPSYTPLPWEITLQMPGEMVRKRHIPLTLEAHDAFNSGASITVEIWAEGKQVGTNTGLAPSVTITKH